MTVSQRFSIYIVVIVSVSVLSALFYSRFSLSHDVSWYLIATRKFMDGAELYSQVVEINPPLAFYLTVPGLWLGDILDVSATTGFVIYCSMIAGVASIWCATLILRSGADVGREITVMVAILAIFFALYIGEFGQREHLMTMLAMPYLLFLVLRSRLDTVRVWERIALGVLAFLGLALKPYFFAIPAGILLARVIHAKNYREAFGVENWTLVILGIGYIAFVFAVHPLYLDHIVPIARLVYDAYGTDTSRVWLRTEVFLLPAALYGIYRWRDRIGTEIVAAVGAAIGAGLCYLLQSKGWNYHLLPLSAWLILATALLMTGNYRLRSLSQVVRFAIVLIPALLIGSQLVRGPYQGFTTKAFAPYVEQADTPILVLSTNVWAAFPFVNEVSGKWSSRYPAQWFIPGAVNRLTSLDCPPGGSQCEAHEAVLDEARSTIISDLDQYRPRLVYIDARAEKSYFTAPFDYRVFLEEDPRFFAIWRCYQQIDTVAEYEVWSRTCPD